MIRSLFARVALSLLLALSVAVPSFAGSYVKEVKLIGGSKNYVQNKWNSYYDQGWSAGIKNGGQGTQDLNEGAGGDYIYLLYKLDSNEDGINYGYITDFYVSNEEGTAPDTRVIDGRVYYLVPYEGETDFVSSKGDLNRGADGDYIHLYYTKDYFPDHRVVTDIFFKNTKQNGAVGVNGGTDGYDFNKGADGEYIYMYFTTTALTYECLEMAGNSLSIDYFPISTAHKYSFSEQIYTAAEIRRSGTITHIAFNYKNMAQNLDPFELDGIQVYMTMTDKESFDGQYVPINARDMVFDGKISASGPGWITLKLDTPFAYDGNHSLVIGCYDKGEGHCPRYLPSSGDDWRSDYRFTGHYTGDKAQCLFCSSDDVIPDLDNIYNLGGIPKKIRSDIQLVIAPDLDCPSKLAVSSCTDVSATLTWEAPLSGRPVSGYVYQFRPAGNADSWPAEVSTSGTSVTFNGLTARSDYQFRVKALYAGGEESVYTNIRFSTAVPLPYDCGFENGMDGWAMVDWLWDKTGISSDEVDTHTGNHGFRFIKDITPEAKEYQYLISPRLPDTAPVKISFWYRSPIITVAYNESFNIGVSYGTDDHQRGFTWSEDIPATQSPWTRYEIVAAAGIKFIAIRFNNSLSTKGVCFDDFTFEAYSNYTGPSDLAVSNLTNHGATISWTSPGGEFLKGFAYQYKPANESAWSDAATLGSNQTSVSLSDLSINTSYQFRVKALFGNSSSSYATISFLTEGDAESLPHFQGFEDGMGGWRVVNADIGSGIYTSAEEYLHTGQASFRFMNSTYAHNSPQILISPQLESDCAMTLSFFYKNCDYESSAYPAYFQVGHSTTAKDLDDFTWSDIMTAKSDDWGQYFGTFPRGTKYIAIMMRETALWFNVDDISINSIANNVATAATLLGEEKYISTFYDGTRLTRDMQTIPAYRLPEGALAYTATLDGDDLVLHLVGDVFTAGEAVIVIMDKTKQDTENTKVYDVSNMSVYNKVERPNILQGSDSPVTVTDGKVDGKTVYVLGVENGVLGLYKFTGSEIPAGKAYHLAQ